MNGIAKSGIVFGFGMSSMLAGCSGQSPEAGPEAPATSPLPPVTVISRRDGLRIMREPGTTDGVRANPMSGFGTTGDFAATLGRHARMTAICYNPDKQEVGIAQRNLATHEPDLIGYVALYDTPNFFDKSGPYEEKGSLNVKGDVDDPLNIITSITGIIGCKEYRAAHPEDTT